MTGLEPARLAAQEPKFHRYPSTDYQSAHFMGIPCPWLPLITTNYYPRWCQRWCQNHLLSPWCHTIYFLYVYIHIPVSPSNPIIWKLEMPPTDIIYIIYEYDTGLFHGKSLYHMYFSIRYGWNSRQKCYDIGHYIGAAGDILPDSPHKLQWHPAFYAAAGLELQANHQEIQMIP